MVKKIHRPDPPYNPAIAQLKNELAEGDVSDTARPIIDSILARWAADHRVFVPRRSASEMLSVSATHLIDLERNGALHSILHCGGRMITADSLYRLMIFDTLESHPANGPMKKARLPPSMHKPKATFGHGGKRANTPPFQPKTSPTKPDHVPERELAAASPSPVSEAKRGRSKKQVEQPAPLPAE